MGPTTCGTLPALPLPSMPTFAPAHLLFICYWTTKLHCRLVRFTLCCVHNLTRTDAPYGPVTTLQYV